LCIHLARGKLEIVAESSRAGRQLLPRPERQASILQAAARAFARTGYATTTMDDVAAEAGISRLIVYRHFGSKEELYRAVLEQVRGRIRERMNPALEEPKAGEYPFRPLIEVAREYPDAFRLLFLHATREPQFAEYARESRAGGVRLAEDIIGDIVGDTISDTVMRTWATHAMVGYIFEALQAWLEVGDPDRDDEFVRRATFGAVAVFSVLTGIAEPDETPELSSEFPGDGSVLEG
jgi:AcrR family transcriptional regulator